MKIVHQAMLSQCKLVLAMSSRVNNAIISSTMYSFDVFETHVAGWRSGFVNQTFFKGDQNLVVIHLKVIAFFLNGVVRLTSMFQLASINFTMTLHRIWS